MSPSTEPQLPNYSSLPNFNPQQHQVLTLLAAGYTLTQAAAAAGVHRNTIRNWRKQIPEFRGELEDAILERALITQEESVRFVPTAIQVIEHTLTAPETSPALRLRAALAMLKNASTPVVFPPAPAPAPEPAPPPTPAQEPEPVANILELPPEIAEALADMQAARNEIRAQSCTTPTSPRHNVAWSTPALTLAATPVAPSEPPSSPSHPNTEPALPDSSEPPC